MEQGKSRQLSRRGVVDRCNCSPAHCRYVQGRDRVQCGMYRVHVGQEMVSVFQTASQTSRALYCYPYREKATLFDREAYLVLNTWRGGAFSELLFPYKLYNLEAKKKGSVSG